MDYTAQIKYIAPGSTAPSLQKLSLAKLFRTYTQDLLETREKSNRTIDIVLCQAPNFDPHIEEYKLHFLHVEKGGRNIVGTGVTLTRLKSFRLESGNMVLINASEYISSTDSTFEDPPGDMFDWILPRNEFCLVNIPLPKPNFWCNRLDLPYHQIPLSYKCILAFHQQIRSLLFT